MTIIILIYHTTKSMGTPFHSPGIWLEDSFLAKCSSATSFCTGCATAEISRAILERDVNSSGKASFHMSIPTIACWATCLASHNLLTPTGVVQLINFIWMGYCKWNINIFYVMINKTNQEYDGTCQRLIQESFKWVESFTLHSHSPCLFGDILGMVPINAFDATDGYNGKLQGIMNCNLSKLQHCHQHNSACTPHKWSIFDVTGLPCPDMSRANHKRLKRAGPTNTVYMTHGKWATVNQIPLLLVECTPDSWIFS